MKEPNVIKTINQAKELFKQQIIDARVERLNLFNEIEIEKAKKRAEQYFNDKFKTESNGTT